MKNNISNEELNEQSRKTDVKCRFFAQYWGQNIIGSTHFKNKKAVIFNYDLFGSLKTNNDIISAKEAFKTYFLHLKPIDKIEDKDVIYCVELMGKKVLDDEIDGFRETFIEAFLNKEFYGTFHPYRVCETIDYLRSKGYAIPFMNYSIDDLVKMGWVQLV